MSFPFLGILSSESLTAFLDTELLCALVADALPFLFPLVQPGCVPECLKYCRVQQKVAQCAEDLIASPNQPPEE